MYKIFDEVYIGSVVELPKLKERNFQACLSISDRFELQDNASIEIEEKDNGNILIPNLNLHKIGHMILSLGENSQNQIGTILPFIYKFLDKHQGKRIFIHCLSGENQSVAILFGYMIYKGVDPISAFTAIITTKVNAQPYKNFITEILDLANIKGKGQEDIIKFIGSDFDEVQENDDAPVDENNIDDSFIEKMKECKSLQDLIKSKEKKEEGAGDSKDQKEEESPEKDSVDYIMQQDAPPPPAAESESKKTEDDKAMLRSPEELPISVNVNQPSSIPPLERESEISFIKQINDLIFESDDDNDSEQ